MSHPSSHADKTFSILYLAHVVFTVDWTMFVTTTAIYTWITTFINKNINEIDNTWQKHIFLAASAAFREKFLFLFCLRNIGSLYIHVTKRFLVYSFLTLDPIWQYGITFMSLVIFFTPKAYRLYMYYP